LKKHDIEWRVAYAPLTGTAKLEFPSLFYCAAMNSVRRLGDVEKAPMKTGKE
jgi:hypothetical protein